MTDEFLKHQSRWDLFIAWARTTKWEYIRRRHSWRKMTRRNIDIKTHEELYSEFLNANK